MNSLTTQAVIGALLERRQTPTQIVYHGTSLKRWKKIQSQGLISSPTDRVWDVDTSSSFSTRSRASIGGTYLTTNLYTAKSAAHNANRKDYGANAVTGDDRVPEVVVFVQVQPRSALADEDDVAFAVESAIPMGDNEYQVARQWAFAEMGETLKDQVQQFVEKAFDFYVFNLDGKVSPQVQTALKAELERGYKIAVDRKAAYVDRNTLTRAAYDAVSFLIPNDRSTQDLAVAELERKQPKKVEAEKSYMKFMERLTVILRKYAEDDDVTGAVMRVVGPISFRGQNKIIGAVSIHSDYTVDKLYGTVPNKFIQDYKKRVGELKWHR